jgi:hypothetical protein
MSRFLLPFRLPKKQDDRKTIVGKRTGGRKRPTPYVRKSSYANLRDYVPSNPALGYTQHGRTSWCDKTYPEFQAAISEAEARNQKRSRQEFLAERVEEMNTARADVGLSEWSFHPSQVEENLTHWYGSAQGKAPLRYKRADVEEYEIAQARRRRTREMMEDGKDAMRRRRRRGLKKSSRFRRMLVKFKIFFGKKGRK